MIRAGSRFLRAKVINAVVSQAVSCFLDNEARMLQGLQEEPLMNMIPPGIHGKTGRSCKQAHLLCTGGGGDTGCRIPG